jgi:AraC-like DNA-binding protein
MKSLPPHAVRVSSTRYCYVEGEITRSRQIRLACAGSEECEPGYRVERSGFPCFGIELVADGTGKLKLDGHSYPLHAGVVFCYGPRVSHSIANPSERPMTKYFVDFFGTEAADLLRAGKLQPGQAMQANDLETIRFLFEQLITEGAKDPKHAAALCAAYLRVILLKLSECVTPSARKATPVDSRFHAWRDFIDANFESLRDLEDIAKELNVRPAQLCRVFQQNGSPGPFRHLTRRKMNRAAELLASGRHPVKEVAGLLGYDDPYHFSRLFKNHFGQSPLHFLRGFWRTGGNP